MEDGPLGGGRVFGGEDPVFVLADDGGDLLAEDL